MKMLLTTLGILLLLPLPAWLIQGLSKTFNSRVDAVGISSGRLDANTVETARAAACCWFRALSEFKASHD